MTPNTDDVAGLVASLRRQGTGEGGYRTLYSAPLLDAAALLESQAKTLREAEQRAAFAEGQMGLEITKREDAEADVMRLHLDKMEWFERCFAAEARLKEAEKVIEPFARAGALFEILAPGDFEQCIYAPAAGRQYSINSAHLRAARAFINAGEK
jgi:hypothetical protein